MLDLVGNPNGNKFHARSVNNIHSFMQIKRKFHKYHAYQLKMELTFLLSHMLI